jgi:lysophospholipase L1-like esterase
MQTKPSEERCCQIEDTNTDLASRDADSRKDSRQYRILCYGDSLTAGFCSKGKHFEPYGPFLARALQAAGIECEVIVCGLSGLTAQDMLRHLKSSSVEDITGQIGRGLAHFLEDEEHQDLVVLMAGTNDLAVDKPEARSVFERVRQLHEACHARGVPTVALTPAAPLPARHRAARLELGRLLAEWRRSTPGVVALADCEELVPRTSQRGRELWDPDDIHMNPEGSRTFGHRLLQVVKGALAHASGGPSERPCVESKAKAFGASKPVAAVRVMPASGRTSWSVASLRGFENASCTLGLTTSSKASVCKQPALYSVQALLSARAVRASPRA